MKIKDVRASVHRLPIFLPLIDAPTEHRNHVLCEVETDEGHVGLGMTARFLTSAVAAILTHDILPAVRDMDPRDLEGREGPEPHRHAHRHVPLAHRHHFVIDAHHRRWPAASND